MSNNLAISRGMILNINHYDAVLLLSNGKGIACILKRLLGKYPTLKILTVMENNGFANDSAIHNAKNIVEKLKTDFLITNTHFNEFSQAFPNGFLNLNGCGSSRILDFIDDQLIFKIGQDIAQDINITLVIGCLSWIQVQNILVLILVN